MPSFAFIFRFLLPPLLYIYLSFHISAPFLLSARSFACPRACYMAFLLFISLRLLSPRSKRIILSRYFHQRIPVLYLICAVVSANPYSPYGPYSLKSLYFTFSTYPRRDTLKVSCSRISAILNRTDGRWFSEGSQKSSRKRRIAEIRDIFHRRWTWVW